MLLTEPGAGSDPSSMTTSAVRDGDAWVLNGSKIFITSGDCAGVFVVWAVTDPAAPKGKGVSVFLVEAGTDVGVELAFSACNDAAGEDSDDHADSWFRATHGRAREHPKYTRRPPTGRSGRGDATMHPCP